MTRAELEITIRGIAGRQLAPRQIKEIMSAAIAYATSDSEWLCVARRKALEEALEAVCPEPDRKQARRLALERQREGGRRGGLAKAANARARGAA